MDRVFLRPIGHVKQCTFRVWVVEVDRGGNDSLMNR